MTHEKMYDLAEEKNWEIVAIHKNNDNTFFVIVKREEQLLRHLNYSVHSYYENLTSFGFYNGDYHLDFDDAKKVFKKRINKYANNF